MYVYEFDIFLNVNDIVHTVNNTKYNKNQLSGSLYPWLALSWLCRRRQTWKNVIILNVERWKFGINYLPPQNNKVERKKLIQIDVRLLVNALMLVIYASFFSGLFIECSNTHTRQSTYLYLICYFDWLYLARNVLGSYKWNFQLDFLMEWTHIAHSTLLLFFWRGISITPSRSMEKSKGLAPPPAMHDEISIKLEFSKFYGKLFISHRISMWTNAMWLKNERER